jgi:hypothetical protein
MTASQQSGGEPWWYLSNDDEFIADEEERCGLPCGSLKPFSRQPYESEVTITEYTTCRNARVDGLLFGSGEMLGDWESFTLFTSHYTNAVFGATTSPLHRRVEFCA